MRLRIDPTSPSGLSVVTETGTNVFVTGSSTSGTSDHAELTNLDYASSGHTGFEPAKGANDNYVTDTEKTNLHAPMSDNQVADGVTITGTGTVGDPFVAVTGGAGDVVGPAGAVDSNFAAFDTNTGKLIKDSSYNSSSFAPALGADDNYVTDAEKANLHAPGSDNQDLSGLAPKANAVMTGTTQVEKLDIDNTSGTLSITAVSDGGDFNISHNESGTKTLAIYGSAGNTMNLTVLDGNITATAGNISAGGTVTGSNLSGTNTGDNAANSSCEASGAVSSHAALTTGVHGVGAGTIAKTSDITATKLDDFATPDNNTDLDANTTNHGLLLKATAPAAGLVNVVGIANAETSYSNKALFDATVPSTQAFGDAAATGSATVAARRDHKHAMPAAPTNATTVTVADEASDTTCFPLFSTAATGDLGPKTNTSLTYNSSDTKLVTTKLGVDTITGKTTSGSTVIAGMQVTNGLVVGGSATGVANSSLSTTAGDLGGAWKTWTPTWANLSGGTLNYAKYTQIGKTVMFRIKYTLGGAGVAGAVTFTTPIEINADYVATSEYINGTVSLYDTGTTSTMGAMRWASSTTIQIVAMKVDVTYASSAPLSSTVPFTWANTDVIQVSGSYEVA